MSALEKVRSVPNAILYKDAKGVEFVRVDKVRFSYPFVGTQGEDEDEQGNKTKSWRATLMLPKATHLAAKNLVKEVILRTIPEGIKVPAANWCLKDGNEKEDELMHGHWLITTSDKRVRPRARNGRGDVMDDIEKIDEMFYGGCWGHALIRPWYFNGTAKGKSKTYPKRVPAGLSAVFFWQDDKPFGSGRVDDSDAWEGVPKQDDEGGGDGMDDNDDDV